MTIVITLTFIHGFLNRSKLALRHTDDLEKFMKPVLCTFPT